MFREMRRIKQQTTKEECEEILKSAKRGVLAVTGDDNYPYAVPLNYIYDKGHIYFHCAKEGHKLDALRNNDKVSFCVLNDGEQEKDDWWYHFTSVIAFGRIREVEDEGEREAFLRMLGGKYFPSEDYLEEEMSHYASKALVLDFEIEHMTGKRVREK